MSYKIAIFENEHVEIEGAFEYLNFKHHFNGALEYKFYASSQSFGDLSNLTNHDLVIMDISLSVNSELDGFSLIEKIEKTVSPIPKILIITGQEIFEGYEKNNGINAYPFLEKPLDYKKLKQKLSELLLS